MTLKRQRILSSRNWPHEAAQARESMAKYPNIFSGRMQRRSQGEFPRCAFSPQVLADAGGFLREDRHLPETKAMSPERALSATIGHGGLA